MSAARDADPLTGTDCSEFLLRVYEYIDDEMTPQDCERLAAHLQDCPQCVEQYERDVLLKAMVRRSCASEPAPEALRLQIVTSLLTMRLEQRDASSG